MRNCIAALLGTIAAVGVVSAAFAADRNGSWDGRLVQFGKMHEAIGQQQHQGRVALDDLVKRPNLFAVAALEGLKGEITIHDGAITVTGVGRSGQLKAVESASGRLKATLLAGAYVPAWTEVPVKKAVEPSGFDQFIGDSAMAAGLDLANPLVFTIEGEFSGLDMHVINGACPIHARVHKITLPDSRKPFEREFRRVKGTLIGIYARDAVGNLTHPATSTHTHVLFTDQKTGKRMTGHIEKAGVIKGAILRLPG